MSRPAVTSSRRRRFAALVIVIGALGATASVARAQNPPETIEYYATDALGSVRVVFTPTGQVLGRSDYLPFGDTLNQSGALPRQRFTGQERDGEAGMDYFNARNLQARTGRMNAPDPLFGDALTNPQRWNRYTYVANNPLGMTDPSGLSPVDKDGQFFAADMGMSESLYLSGGGGGLRLDASGHTMGAITWTDLGHEYLVAAEQAKAGALTPNVTSSHTFLSPLSDDEMKLLASEAYAESTSRNTTIEQYSAMISTVVNRVLIDMAQGKASTITSVLNSTVTVKINGISVAVRAYQAMGSNNFTAAQAGFASGHPSAQMDLAYRAAQSVGLNGPTTNATGFAHNGASPAGAYWVPAVPASIGNLSLYAQRTPRR